MGDVVCIGVLHNFISSMYSGASALASGPLFGYSHPSPRHLGQIRALATATKSH